MRTIKWKKDKYAKSYSFETRKFSVFVEVNTNNQWYWVIKLKYGKGALYINTDYSYGTSKAAKKAARYFVDEWNIWW